MSDLSKTINYLKRNGLKETYYAVKERLFYREGVPYHYENLTPVARENQFNSELNREGKIKFSILIPVYETPEKYLRETINSCLNQTYKNFEVILGDASKTKSPEMIIKSFTDERVKYFKIEKNGGISDNTNYCIDKATGDYMVLLDHDDLITEDALYENARMIMEEDYPEFIYSDEDKTDAETASFFDPHIKPDYNKDLLFSNNYICHLAVIKSDVLRRLKLRKEYDGSQDYDLFLRIAKEYEKHGKILHINRVLYHWRCHDASTASNPASKDYAYTAGLRALQSITDRPVKELLHKGFYKVDFGRVPEIFELRPDIGAVGGLIIKRGKIAGGIYDEDGNIMFNRMNAHYSGYFHRAHLTMDVYALDLRNIKPRVELRKEYKEILKDLTDDNAIAKSLQFARIARERGYKLLFDPMYNRS